MVDSSICFVLVLAIEGGTSNILRWTRRRSKTCHKMPPNACAFLVLSQHLLEDSSAVLLTRSATGHITTFLINHLEGSKYTHLRPQHRGTPSAKISSKKCLNIDCRSPLACCVMPSQVQQGRACDYMLSMNYLRGEI